MIRLFFLILILLGCSGGGSKNPPSEENRIGLDWLAAQHPRFDLGTALSFIDGKRPIGVLDWTFGESIHPIRLILDSGKINAIRVHFVNSVCVRNQNCGAYEYGHGHTIASFNEAIIKREKRILSRFKERVSLYCDLARSYSEIEFFFSWALEHNLSIDAWSALDAVARETCDANFHTVNNPVERHDFPVHPRVGVLFESHHSDIHPQSDLNSLDGEPVEQIHISEWKSRIKSMKNLRLAFVWSESYNCRVPGPFIDPRDRIGCPTPDKHREIIQK